MTTKEDLYMNEMRKLRNNQNVIQEISKFFRNLPHDARRISIVWLGAVTHEKRMDQLLCLLYLANDIIQNSIKSTSNFQIELGKCFDKGLMHIAKHADNKSAGSVDRVLQVWKERKIYDEASINRFINTFHSNLNSESIQAHISRGKSHDSPANASEDDANDNDATTSTYNGIKNYHTFSTEEMHELIDSECKWDEDKKELKRQWLAFKHGVDSDSGLRNLFTLPSDDEFIIKRFRYESTLDDPLGLKRDVSKITAAFAFMEKADSNDTDTRDRIANHPKSIADELSISRQWNNREERQKFIEMAGAALKEVKEFIARLKSEYKKRLELQKTLYHLEKTIDIHGTSTLNEALRAIGYLERNFDRQEERTGKVKELLPDFEGTTSIQQLPGADFLAKLNQNF